jgi:hypothetical protein
MKTIIFIALIFVFFSISNSFSQSLKEQLLGNWKLHHDEGMEMFLNSSFILQQPREEYNKTMEWTKQVFDNSYMNFYSLDSMTSTVMDRKEIIQDKSSWEFQESDSVITYKIRFTPFIQQSKVLKITSDELVLIYIDRKSKAETFKSTYRKVGNN